MKHIVHLANENNDVVYILVVAKQQASEFSKSVRFLQTRGTIGSIPDSTRVLPATIRQYVKSWKIYVYEFMNFYA